MTREDAARFPYGSAGAATTERIEGVATAEQLHALADFAAEQARRDKWRHTAGLDSNWHGQIIAELEDTL